MHAVTARRAAGEFARPVERGDRRLAVAAQERSHPKIVLMEPVVGFALGGQPAQPQIPLAFGTLGDDRAQIAVVHDFDTGPIGG